MDYNFKKIVIYNTFVIDPPVTQVDNAWVEYAMY